MISTRNFISAIILLSVLQYITYSNKTGTTVGTTKPNKDAYIAINKSETPSEEKALLTEEIPEKKSMTSRFCNLITKPVSIFWRPLQGVLSSSVKTAVNLYLSTDNIIQALSKWNISLVLMNSSFT